MSENVHPAAMFEFIAVNQQRLCDFYQAVFGWTYEIRSGFAYIDFPFQARFVLGGIGQSQPNTPGWEPGRSFYLGVDDLQQTLAKVIEQGGTEYVPPTEADSYHFAMFTDPEGNIVGLLQTKGEIDEQN